MSWLQQLGGLLGQYGGGQPGGNPVDDFGQFAQGAPPDALAHGMAHAFRSDQTPPFPNMLGQLFGQSDPHQRAGLLNTLMGAVGPSMMQQALGGMFGGGQVTPEQAARMSPHQIQQLAGMAEQHDPGIIDQVSGFFGQHPGVFQSLGAGALGTALMGMAQRHGGGGQGDVLPASMDPYGDPADAAGGRGGVLPASQDPYGDPADRY